MKKQKRHYALLGYKVAGCVFFAMVVTAVIAEGFWYFDKCANKKKTERRQAFSRKFFFTHAMPVVLLSPVLQNIGIIRCVLCVYYQGSSRQPE